MPFPKARVGRVRETLPPAPITDPNDPALAELAGAVRSQNALAAATAVRGCTPPRWTRCHRGHPSLPERWYALGGEGTYLRMPREERLGIRIDSEPVVEIDVKASHLTIALGLAGRAGLPSPGAIGPDPYEGLGVPREVVKRWILETCGKGGPPRSWAMAAPPAVRSHRPGDVQAAVVTRYPVLADPRWLVPDGLADALGLPVKHLVAPVLVALEAEAITAAMAELRARGILSLPVHDALIVPVSALVLAETALREAYRTACGRLPQLHRTALPGVLPPC